MQKFTSTKLFKVIIITAVFAGIIFFLPQNIFNPVRSGFTFILVPFQKFFYAMSVDFSNIKDFVGSIGQLKKENEQLRKDNQALLTKNATCGSIENENSTLREQLNMLPRDKYNLIPAFLAGQDPNKTGNWIEIDKGSYDGITAGMPVIVSNGILIGKVEEVNAKNSKVVLLTNSKSIINVMTTENGIKGIIRGEYGLGIILDMVLQTDSINVGDSIVTSGLGGDIPRGLYVGTIQEIHQSDDHLFQQAILSVPVQIPKLQIVFVIKSVK
jgi:rod shape-determining protein MreC